MAYTGRDVLHGISIEKPLRKSEESFHIPSVPERVSAKQIMNRYLCMGPHSPCEQCDPPCRYGREWLEHKKNGTVPEVYKKEAAAQLVRAAKANMRDPNIMADILRRKGEELNDPDLVAAAIVMEELHDRNERQREKLTKAAQVRKSDRLTALNQLRKDLAVLSAYTGYRLVPLAKEDAVLKIVSKCLCKEMAVLDLSEEEHETVRSKLRFAVGEIIARAYGLASKEDIP